MEETTQNNPPQVSQPMPPNQSPQAPQSPPPQYGYGKRPWWQWLIIYIIVGAIAYGLVYYFFIANNGTSNYSSQENQQNYQSPSVSVEPTNNALQNMKIETVKEGTGEGAKVGDTVTVNYTGTLENGTKFDSSLNPGRTPFEFTLGQNKVIQGWELGVLGMKVGEERKLTIPPELGYGANGVGNIIPPNATLIFTVDLLKITPAK